MLDEHERRLLIGTIENNKAFWASREAYARVKGRSVEQQRALTNIAAWDHIESWFNMMTFAGDYPVTFTVEKWVKIAARMDDMGYIGTAGWIVNKLVGMASNQDVTLRFTGDGALLSIALGNE